MKKMLLLAAGAALLASGTAHAAEGLQPLAGTFGRLDHVFLIMMENQTSTDILGNPNAPFINEYAGVANHASNYFAVGHPSAPNYLEIVGGSNFGLTNDFWPAWFDGGCIDNAPGSTGCVGAIPPINSIGMDNPVVATATNFSTQCNGQVSVNGLYYVTNPITTPVTNNCALHNYGPSTYSPKMIADQLVAKGKTWKSYQEDLPAVVPGVVGINYSDGELSNLSPPAAFVPGSIQKLYAVKHNPFVYFASVQMGNNPELSLDQVKDFDGPAGLWADLQSGNSPHLSFIVPNQCHDQHGFVSGGTPICSTSNEAEEELLLAQGDAEVSKLINGIKSSRSWSMGRNAIVLVWDENDYSNAANRVVMLVETNYAANGRVESANYDHFSLLRTIEAGFGLPCLNHACDPTSITMNAMFGGH
jgi:hypothetical protein